MKIIADNKIPFLKGVFEPFGIEVEYCPGNEIDSARVKEADALIIRTRTRCNETLLKGSKVKFIATATIGFDHIDTHYCNHNDIVWKNAPGCNSGSVMQYMASVLTQLALQQNFSFNKTTLGVVGVGNVGSKVAAMASLLGMKVLLNDPPRARAEGKTEFLPLDEIARKADIITFHVPLNRGGADNTFHLVDDEFIERLKPCTTIINASRGEVVSNNALKNALKQKRIKAAVLDVWENEPNIDNELLSLVSIATPHIAGYSMDGKVNGTAMSVRAISNFFNLGLAEWYPKHIPLPEKTEIEIDCSGLSLQQAIGKAIVSTYDVLHDDNRLRKSAHTFEYQRNNYPVRREFNAFKVRLTNATTESVDALKKLGFKI